MLSTLLYTRIACFRCITYHTQCLPEHQFHCELRTGQGAVLPSLHMQDHWAQTSNIRHKHQHKWLQRHSSINKWIALLHNDFITMSIERSQRKAQVCKNLNILVSTQCNDFQPAPDGSQTSAALMEIPLDSSRQLAPTILQHGDSPPVLPRPSPLRLEKEHLLHLEIGPLPCASLLARVLFVLHT